MDESTIQCPYCGELVSFELEPDTEGSFVQDCEVCCRPWQVRVMRDENGEPRIVVERG